MGRHILQGQSIYCVKGEELVDQQDVWYDLEMQSLLVHSLPPKVSARLLVFVYHPPYSEFFYVYSTLLSDLVLQADTVVIIGGFHISGCGE